MSLEAWSIWLIHWDSCRKFANWYPCGETNRPLGKPFRSLGIDSFSYLAPGVGVVGCSANARLWAGTSPEVAVRNLVALLGRQIWGIVKVSNDLLKRGPLYQFFSVGVRSLFFLVVSMYHHAIPLLTRLIMRFFARSGDVRCKCMGLSQDMQP